MAKHKLFFIVSGILVVGAVALGADVDSTKVMSMFSETANSQIAQAGFFFTIAAWLHAGRVKKEIKENFATLTTAINHVAEAFKEDLKRHGERLDNLSYRVKTLEDKQP